MTPQRLLQQFDRISDAPDAIPLLRRFILDLAVRGKLVEQDPREEPAAELLKRIKKDTSERKAIGKYSDPRNSIEILLDSLPFAVPASWGWARLIEIADICYGFAFESSRFNLTKTGKPLIRIRDISSMDTEAYYDGDFDEAYLVRKGDYLVGMDGDFNVRKWKGSDGLLNQRVMRINNWRASLVAEFLAIPLQMILDHLHSATSQTTVKHLSAKQTNGIYLPLPPLAEQHRIVAKVDELMALCDRLQAAQVERESQRVRLVGSSLNRLDNGTDPDAFRDHARFYFNHLPRLTTKPEHIHQLRQTIRSLAIRGKLVPQDPNNEPAAEMIGKHELFPGTENEPWQLPSGWAWSSLDLIGETLGGGTPSKADPENWNGKIPWVSPKDMKVDIIEDVQDHISESAVENSSVRLIPTGSLLMVVRGMILAHSFPTAISAVPLTINQDMKAIIPFRPDLVRMLLLLTKGLKPEVLRLVLRSTHGTCKLLTADLFSLPIPIPPLAEQQRIVAKVDELMALCDKLEAQLTTTQTESRRLLEAVLHHALAPTV